MIRKALLLKIFEVANMHRWNDKIRPVELRELDKQAHKMVIAYFLGKFEEGREGFDWIRIIEGGIFEFLQRMVLTDLKPQIFYKIKEDGEKYKRLNEWVYGELESVISPLGEGFCNKFRSYFEKSSDNINRRVLSASHFYATKWEFDIIERANPGGYEIGEIKRNLQSEQEKYYDLRGIQQLALYEKYRNFVDLCGQLRFQIRWSHIHRLPKTSVLGHMLIVAVLSYLFSLEINACRRRCINNYFNGLFHDLPEVLTRDIISPVKRSVEGLSELIKDYEREQMEKEIYGLLPEDCHAEMRMFTENEFTSAVTVNGKTVETGSDEISSSYNKDEYNPRDGEIIEAADHLAAFIEAYMAIENGMKARELVDAKNTLYNRYSQKTVAGIKFGEIYADFE
ncbi:5'-nucleotidase [bacterium BMS3Abin07]|nr:5'-nucleotidase [bacterium BMS3Abin07]GBE31913.1 5'-nucleotidase [bacterium BMS3Bbin05]HDL20486.1 HD domain-containing protein [Nitrospirota bacterium]HDZ87115.1 HD domain-containing protein [Nitrospirota bacterium]